MRSDNVQSLSDVYLLRQVATERAEHLRRAGVTDGSDHSRRPLERWLGEQLVRVGHALGANAIQPARPR